MKKNPETKGSTQESGHSRRGFLRLGGAAVAASSLSLNALGCGEAEPEAPGVDPSELERRRNRAYDFRHQAALDHRHQPVAEPLTNGDEALYPDHLASYSKALQHDARGVVVPESYASLVAALASGRPEDFEAIRLGGSTRLASPQSAFAYTLEGPDTHELGLPPPPAFASAGMAADMVEVYWQALAREVPFNEYLTDPLIAAASTELSALSAYPGPKSAGSVVPETLFRGNTSGDLVGPYLSQFLWMDVPYGATRIVQKYKVTAPGDDYLKTYESWLAVQRGAGAGSNTFDAVARYLRNGRDLGEYVHRDFSIMPYLNACLILLKLGNDALHPANPYLRSATQRGNVTWGDKHAIDMMSRMSFAAEKASWYQKWLVHRRLRPEAFAGRVHNHLTQAASYPLHADLLGADVLQRLFDANGTYLLPMAYPEGSPTHPSYPAAHAATAGACVTALKAFFNESFVLPNTVVSSADGLSLLPYNEPLTVGGELNKLAANIALGRDFAGVHYRSDGIEGLKLGEAVAIGILRDWKEAFNEGFGGVTLTKFDGTTVTL
jgi:membrane-associated phospholipid phosphatase